MMHSGRTAAAIGVENQPRIAIDLFFQNEHMTASYGHHIATWRSAWKFEPARG
jgi:hypothetical protein